MRCIFILLLSFTLNAQHNFEIKNNDVVWEKVFYEGIKPEEIKNQLLSSGNFKNLTVSGSRVLGDLKEKPIDFKGAGAKRMTTSM